MSNPLALIVVVTRQDPAVVQQDIAGVVSLFVPDRDFLFFALSCTDWRAVWSVGRPKLTAAVTRFTTESKLRESFSLGLQPSEGVACGAARLGRIDLLTVALVHRCPIGIKTFRAAAEAGQLSAVKWLEGVAVVDRRSATVCSAAAGRGHLSMLVHLRDIGFAWDLTTCCKAALGGFDEVVEYCLDHGCTNREDGMIVVLHSAARSGNIKMLQKLVRRFQYELNMNDAVMRGGIESGDLGVVRWVRGVIEARDGHSVLVWEDSMWRSAAYAGGIHILEWAWEFAKRSDVPNHAPCTIMSWAALSNRVEALAWLHQKGFLCDGGTWKMAGDDGVVSFLRSIGCPGS